MHLVSAVILLAATASALPAPGTYPGHEYDYLPDCHFSSEELRDAELQVEDSVCSIVDRHTRRVLRKCHISVSSDMPPGVHTIFGISDKAKRSNDPSGYPGNGQDNRPYQGDRQHQDDNRQHQGDNRQHDSNNREHYPPNNSPDCCGGNNQGQDYNHDQDNGYNNPGQDNGYNNHGGNDQGYSHDYLPDCHFSSQELRDAEFQVEDSVCSIVDRHTRRVLRKCHISVSSDMPPGVHTIFGISDKAKRAEDLTIEQILEALKLVFKDPALLIAFLKEIMSDPAKALKDIFKLGMPTTGAMTPDTPGGSTTIVPSTKRQIQTGLGCDIAQYLMMKEVLEGWDHLQDFRKYHPDAFATLAQLFIDYLTYCGGKPETWTDIVPDLANPDYTSGIVPGNSGVPGLGGGSTTIGSGTTIGGGPLHPR